MILAYQNTPMGVSSSPMEHLTGRKARTTIPVKPSLLQDRVIKGLITKSSSESNNGRQSTTIDQPTLCLSSFKVMLYKFSPEKQAILEG